ncbi:MAG: PepSY domain-containing protein, partial [Gluconacetobacter diazotrophicus]|nr:PepSY domain-containing protein [Gluconacetobacter diazotrophicus]
GLRTRPLIELHRAAGLWLLLPLLVLAATSVAFNAYFDVFVPVLDRLSPPRAGGPADHVPFPAAPSAIPRPIGFVAALAAAERVAATELPALSPATLGDAGSRGYAVRFSPGGTLLDKYAGPATIFVGRFDGRPLWIDRPSLDGWGRIAERAVYSLHSGQVLGWPTRLLVLALGLATVGFTVTGFLPWWRRTRRRSAASRPPTMSRR